MTKPATDDAGEGDDYRTFMCGNYGGVKRLTRKRDMVNDGSDTKYQSCSEFRLDGGVGSSVGSTH